jgi:hypothetical protein
MKFFFSYIFFLQFWVIKALDPDPDPDEMNADPQPWLEDAVVTPTMAVIMTVVLL